MEKIFLEKVSAIQKNVAEWEAKFNAEKARDIEQLKVHHQRQDYLTVHKVHFDVHFLFLWAAFLKIVVMNSSSFSHNRKLSDERGQVEALEASLNAARREADALREQIQVPYAASNFENIIQSGRSISCRCFS